MTARTPGAGRYRSATPTIQGAVVALALTVVGGGALAACSGDSEATQTSTNVPQEYAEALRTAREALHVTWYSYDELYDELTSEHVHGYSEEAARYALDTLDVDWKGQALAVAQLQVNGRGISRAGLLDYLSGDLGKGYTADEARYAAEHVEVDWNEEALEAALEYSKDRELSDSDLYNQLTSEYGGMFTPEEAQNAINNLP